MPNLTTLEKHIAPVATSHVGGGYCRSRQSDWNKPAAPNEEIKVVVLR